ncbi:hypothetical protein [Cognatiluteimonas weifangensis]|uniref:DUF2007 domain-containing protein n=1 Tax=Cognatiluteimonas weifangensis TaxID=2303539 RepID=A0A372DKS6_9GAMM|nr:hypothetical protein [Luteimonas weifangensis]RFP59912.1 hypothetical protein D0Y53_09115 [Luteimonas weifangensis]
MRQVFSSPRLENVERVAQLLGEAGIQTRITHGRSYRGGRRSNFSYRDAARTEPEPAVWVIRSEDQPAARRILRDAGLLDSTRGETGYTFRSTQPAAGAPGHKSPFRLKLWLLLAVVVAIALALLSQVGPGPVAPGTPPPTAAALPAGVSPTPDALAVAVLAGELPTRADQALCLSVDGHDPAPALLAALPPTPGRVIPLSQCPTTDLPRLSIADYRVHAAGGAGSITLSRARDADAPPVLERYEVSHGARGWRVVELL